MRQLKITQSITNRESASVDKYLQEIGRIALITAEEEVALTKRIKLGDEVALEKLTKANLRFVVSVAKQYQSSGLTLSDLINEGNLGLIKAAQRFDETKGFKFISYAVWWIRQSVMQAIAEHSRIVRLPLNRVSSLNKLAKAFVHLEQKFERAPCAEELALLLNLPLEEVETTLGIGGRHVSLDAPFQRSDNEGSLMDVLHNPNAEDTDFNVSYHESLRNDINRSFTTLTSRQGDILKMYFGIGTPAPQSLGDIAFQLDLTIERVRQIKDKALLRLRNTGRSKLLRRYLS